MRKRYKEKEEREVESKDARNAKGSSICIERPHILLSYASSIFNRQIDTSYSWHCRIGLRDDKRCVSRHKLSYNDNLIGDLFFEGHTFL
jgi:hypothetical protein